MSTVQDIKCLFYATGVAYLHEFVDITDDEGEVIGVNEEIKFTGGMIILEKRE